MARVLAWAGAILAGLGLGAASAWACLIWAPGWYAFDRDGWSTNRAFGQAAQGPYMHAAASTRAFAPPPSEIRSYTLNQDEAGAPLSEACIYELSGEAFPARWWSVTLYSRRGALIDNGDHAFVIDSNRTAKDARGAWSARLAPVRGEALNWLSTRAARRDFIVELRLYQPRRDIEGREPPLPRLQTLSCAEPRG
jgi:hypothetical protein